jgi:trans-AT polyketide synthase/acyltransferase/oxidoreductase domain-containing protein
MGTLVFMFPGQGAQKKGMGAGLFEKFPRLVRRVDDELGYGIERLCLDDPDKRLGQTAFTQVALYVVNSLHYYQHLRETGRRPDAVAGHSVGEYNALLAAEALDFMGGLRLVRERAQLMASATGGGMAAVLGIAPERIRALLDQGGLSDVDIANYNAPTQTVISGPAELVKRAATVLQQGGAASVIPLRVSGPFHSRYMQPARERFSDVLGRATFQRPSIPVMSNYTGAFHRDDELPRNMARQIDSPVRWSDNVLRLLELGDVELTEIGPGTVLSGLVKQIRN